jgi:alkanesulfonate monooxygenase SsuD/methylene tetrahydromethanopterin reductase-like flavin-dependent oxidoreductase (luciferase family)
MRYADAWNTWYADTENSPAGVPPLQDVVDAACREVGRDPAAVRRTVAVHVRLPGGRGRITGDASTQRFAPLEGPPERIADALRAYAAVGVAEVQAVLDPIDRPSIEAFAKVLPLLDA